MKEKDLFDLLTFALFGRKASECIEKEICVECGKPAENFRTVKNCLAFLSFAVCQRCQDKVGKLMQGGDDMTHAE